MSFFSIRVGTAKTGGLTIAWFVGLLAPGYCRSYKSNQWSHYHSVIEHQVTLQVVLKCPFWIWSSALRSWWHTTLSGHLISPDVDKPFIFCVHTHTHTHTHINFKLITSYTVKSLIHNNFTLEHQHEFNYEFAFFCFTVNEATPVKGVHFRDHTAYTIIRIGSTEIQISVCPLTTSIYVKLGHVRIMWQRRSPNVHVFSCTTALSQ